MKWKKVVKLKAKEEEMEFLFFKITIVIIMFNLAETMRAVAIVNALAVIQKLLIPDIVPGQDLVRLLPRQNTTGIISIDIIAVIKIKIIILGI
jgi:hypothetical protein